VAILAQGTKIIAKVQESMDSETKHEAFALFQAGAELGEPNAMDNLAKSYRRGFGVSRNYDKALEWYEKAAAKGDADAMFDLGELYQEGQDEGGQGVPRNYDTAREWYEKSAARNHSMAMVSLGWFYEHGYGGVQQDYVKARELFEKAAAMNNVIAMYDVGLLYVQGRGVPQDYAKALPWFEKAAKAAAGAHGVLKLIYSNPNSPEGNRIKAAIGALPHETPKLMPERQVLELKAEEPKLSLGELCERRLTRQLESEGQEIRVEPDGHVLVLKPAAAAASFEPNGDGEDHS
jgi:TPR repeat protein